MDVRIWKQGKISVEVTLGPRGIQDGWVCSNDSIVSMGTQAQNVFFWKEIGEKNDDGGRQQLERRQTAVAATTNEDRQLCGVRLSFPPTLV